MPQPTPPDRAVNALADALDGSRARTPHDATDPGIPVAATVVLVRDAVEGVEVLMIERPDRGSFAGAWVFPGGKLEPADRHGEDEAEQAVALRAGVRETAEETGLVLDAADLTPLSCWDPPPGLALRIRTWFFVAPAQAGEGALPVMTLAADEAVAAEWVNPADALARHGRGEFTLYPPTWVTLHGLLGHSDAASVIDAARLSGIQRFETVARRGAEGPMLLWAGDAEYDGDAGGESSVAAEAGRHRLEIGALPWVYTRAG